MESPGVTGRFMQESTVIESRRPGQNEARQVVQQTVLSAGTLPSTK
jgi:hypothetical protein